MEGKFGRLIQGGVWFVIFMTFTCGRKNLIEPLINLEEVGRCFTLGYAQDVTVVDSFAYIATGQGCLEIMDVSIPDNPFVVGSFDTTVGTVNYATAVKVKDGKAYIGYGYDGLLILDVTNPAEPEYLGKVVEFRVDDLDLRSVGDFTYAYVAARHYFAIINVTDPMYPSYVGRYETPGRARGLFVDDVLAYVADEQLGLQIMDVSNPFSPNMIGGIDTPSNSRDVSARGDYAYIADGRGGLQVVDVTNTDSLRIVGHCNTPGYAKKIVLYGDYAFVADGSEGLQVIDVSDPTSPDIVGNYSTPYAHGVFVNENHVFLADRDLGLIILTHFD